RFQSLGLRFQVSMLPAGQAVRTWPPGTGVVARAEQVRAELVVARCLAGCPAAAADQRGLLDDGLREPVHGPSEMEDPALLRGPICLGASFISSRVPLPLVHGFFPAVVS